MDQQGLERDTQPPITNERIARMLGWKESQHYDYSLPRYWKLPDDTRQTCLPQWHETLDLCLRDILPEIVRRGYGISIVCDSDEMCVYLYRPAADDFLERFPIEPTDPPSIARAICEALVRTEGKS